MRTPVDALAVWAVRYALGRMTYAVDDVVDALFTNRVDLTDNSCRVIIEDIDQALKNS